MGLEIERKFAVMGDTWREQVSRSVEMRQGYLSSTDSRASVRVRLEGEQARLNIKAAVVGAARAEYEYPMPVEDCRHILETLCIGRVEKIRHFIEFGGLTWEVDEFLGDNAGLIVAEVELESVEQRFERPAWAGAELTEDARYYNHALALHPYAQWGEVDGAA